MILLNYIRGRGVFIVNLYISASGLESLRLGERNGYFFLKKRVLSEWFRDR